MGHLVEIGASEAPPVPTRDELEAAGINIICAVPMERAFPSDTFAALWMVAAHGWPLISRPYDRTDSNRNWFARALLENPDFTHVCMLDLDQVHPQDTVECLARWVMADPERTVVSGLHFRRGAPFDPLAMLYDAEGRAHPIADWPAPLIRCDVIGHGSVLIHRSVFETLPSPWWAYTYGSEFTFPSEDMYFCRRLYEASIPIWVDTTLTAPHLITSVVDEQTFRDYLRDHPELIGERSAPSEAA